MIHQSQTPIIRNLGDIPGIPFIARLGDDIVIKPKLVVGGYDEVGGDVPDLETSGERVLKNEGEGEDEGEERRRGP
jgi:hypothetical protein